MLVGFRGGVLSIGRSFGDAADKLSRNPLGIIALFQVLVEAIAALVTARLDASNTAALLPLVWFLVLFPVAVLAVFTYLVACHHSKLYGPRDYTDEANFMKGVALPLQRTANQVSAEYCAPDTSQGSTGSETPEEQEKTE
jgi:hypothetical protein